MKKTAKTALWIILAIVLGCIGITLVMFIGKICPPEGPWPMPPWCNAGGDETIPTESASPSNTPVPTQRTDQFQYVKPGQAAEFLRNPVLFTHNWKLPEHDQNISQYLDGLNPGGVTWIQYNFDNDFIFDSIDYYHSRNIPIIGAGMTPRHTNSDQPDPDRDRRLAIIDLDGNPITLVKPGLGVQTGRYWRNILEPEWQEEMIETAKKMVDAGIQGINFDEIFSNASAIYDVGGSFDELSMIGFQHYLEAKYSSEQLSAMFNIDTIETFNFKEYILARGMQATWNKDINNPLPLTFAFYQFQLSESEKFLRRFDSELSEYSRERYDREFFFSYNASPLYFQHTGDMEYLDYLTGEQFYFMGGGTFPKSAGVIRLAEPQTNKTALLIEVSNDRGKIPAQTKNLYKYFFADIYAAGGEMITSANSFMTFAEGWNYAGDDDYIRFDPAEAGKYVNFMKDNQYLFGLDRPTKVAVVNSYATRELVFSPYNNGSNYWDFSNDLLGVTEMLLDMNVPFRVVASGDPRQPLLRLTTEMLSEFQIVILPSILAISDEEVQALIDFTESGGIVLQINDFGLRDTDGQKTTRSELAALRSAGEHSVGEGKWWTEYLALHSYYWGSGRSFAYLPTETTRDNPTYVSFLKTLSRYYSPEVISEGPITVNVHRYQDENRMVLHLVNYDYDQTIDEFHPSDPFNLTIDLQGNAYKNAKLYSFEDQSVTEIPFEIVADKMVIQIPAVYSYAILELLP
jgi:hypothetical protein